MSDLTRPMMTTIRHALKDYLDETDRQIWGSHTTVPAEHDSCCEYHLARWRTQDEIQKGFIKRRDGIVDALREINKMLYATDKDVLKAEAQAKHEKEKA